MEGEDLSNIFNAGDDLFSILEAFEGCSNSDPSSFQFHTEEPKSKKQKIHVQEMQHQNSHIRVERNRRKQMNEHLSVLRSLMPSFYVKRGDQASIIGGVIDYITELRQILQSLEAKKQRKLGFSDYIPSPRPCLSPHTPLSPCNSSTSSVNDGVNELAASSKSAVAQIDVKFSGSNLMLNTASHDIRGQCVKIVAALSQFALHILHLNIIKVDQMVTNSFTIKVGIDCQLSAEELAEVIQQTFC